MPEPKQAAVPNTFAMDGLFDEQRADQTDVEGVEIRPVAIRSLDSIIGHRLNVRDSLHITFECFTPPRCCLALATAVSNTDDLAMTDPALYKTLRDQITLFHLRGGGALNLEALERLAAGEDQEGRRRAMTG